MDASVKLQKYLADCGLMSRRAAEREIAEGRVTVNGRPAVLGDRVTAADLVEYRGRVVVKKRGDHPVYLMLNKPVGYVTTMSDDKGRKTVADLLTDVGVRVYPVGRLDMDSEGLLLFTSDGAFANAMTHPRHGIPKYYDVTVAGALTRTQLAALSMPMVIDGYEIAPVECFLLKRAADRSLVRMILYEGRNRQIRKMCEQVGVVVKRLRRVAIGDLVLDVGRGKWRYLNKEEVDALKAALDRSAPSHVQKGNEKGKDRGADTGKDRGAGTGKDRGAGTGKAKGAGTGKDKGTGTGKDKGGNQGC